MNTGIIAPDLQKLNTENGKDMVNNVFLREDVDKIKIVDKSTFV